MVRSLGQRSKGTIAISSTESAPSTQCGPTNACAATISAEAAAPSCALIALDGTGEGAELADSAAGVAVGACPTGPLLQCSDAPLLTKPAGQRGGYSASPSAQAKSRVQSSGYVSTQLASALAMSEAQAPPGCAFW